MRGGCSDLAGPQLHFRHAYLLSAVSGAVVVFTVGAIVTDATDGFVVGQASMPWSNSYEVVSGRHSSSGSVFLTLKAHTRRSS